MKPPVPTMNALHVCSSSPTQREGSGRESGTDLALIVAAIVVDGGLVGDPIVALDPAGHDQRLVVDAGCDHGHQPVPVAPMRGGVERVPVTVSCMM